MKKQKLLRIILVVSLTTMLFAVITPASATCIRKVIHGPNSFVSSDTGTAGNDLIICEDGAEMTGEIRGLQGDDVILVYKSYSGDKYIAGDRTAASGDDTIIVFGSNRIISIAGDFDLNGGKMGDDSITLYGLTDNILGDSAVGDSVTDVGGDDTIDVHGEVFDTLYGDYIPLETNLVDLGGDDVITIRQGGVVNLLVGDYLLSTNVNSKGGNDRIIIDGTVKGALSGDDIVAGTGGNDTIIVTQTGSVGENSGNTHNVIGDFGLYAGGGASGGNDDILIEGKVYGSVLGDYANNEGGDDDIVIGSTGMVEADVIGDLLDKDTSKNGNDTIEVSGLVKGDVFGDGFVGNAGQDHITVETFGAVLSLISGDGVGKEVGNANGVRDNITIKGKVGGNVVGDDVDGNGGPDSIVIQGFTQFSTNHGFVNGDVSGDAARGNGGADQITTTQFSQVKGTISGDNALGDGGNDNIQVNGRVGASDVLWSILGDNAAGDGGDDFILVGKYALVYGRVDGDNVDGKAGQDLIWIDGRVVGDVLGDKARTGNAKDQIAVRQGGIVNGSVIGDSRLEDTINNGGWDVINIIGGQVDNNIYGDDVKGMGGNDFIAVRMNGLVKKDVVGDKSNNNGGNDTISIINGRIWGNVIGDDTNQHGGDDKITVLVAGQVNGDVFGDVAGQGKRGGDDNIFVAGKVNGSVIGDHKNKQAYAGTDTIQTSPSAVIKDGVIGDFAKGKGGNDIIKINGTINHVPTVQGNTAAVRGDLVTGDGGNDTISVFSLGVLNGDLVGDDSDGNGGNDMIFVAEGGKVNGDVLGDLARGKYGGNDTIIIEGRVTGSVFGDYMDGTVRPDYGGDDVIIIEETAVVNGNVIGDQNVTLGGDDIIDIKGTVDGYVLGNEGNDTITIYPTAVIGKSVCGENICTTKPDDDIIYLDEDANPALDSADTIIIAGKVLGDVIAGTTYGSHSDDIVVVFEGAEIGGTIYAGDEASGDTFVYVENIINEEKTISEVVNSVNEKNGKITVNGVTYTLDDVENVAGAVGQIACFGMDYRLNKTSDGCSARSGAEKDAIQWHRDNPGNDGRLPGLEGCAVYTYGNGLRVYEILDGAEGELVAEIWGDVLSDAPASNELLGQTANGNVSLYHLASGELQIECRNLVDGKMQVRVLSDLAGTVSNAYDKS